MALREKMTRRPDAPRPMRWQRNWKRVFSLHSILVRMRFILMHFVLRRSAMEQLSALIAKAVSHIDCFSSKTVPPTGHSRHQTLSCCVPIFCRVRRFSHAVQFRKMTFKPDEMGNVAQEVCIHLLHSVSGKVLGQLRRRWVHPRQIRHRWRRRSVERIVSGDRMCEEGPGTEKRTPEVSPCLA